MALPHRVRRLSWRVAAPDPATAFALRTALNRDLDTALLPAIDAAFAAAAPGEALVHLPRLEIHLKLPSLAALEAELPGLLRSRLREQLALLGSEEAPAGTVDTPIESSLEHYLAHGNVPWFDARRAAGELAAALAAEARAWSRDLPWAWARLLRTVPSDTAAALAYCFRLLTLLDATERLIWLEWAAAQATGPAASPATRLLRLALAEAASVPGNPAATDQGAPRRQALALALAASPGWAAGLLVGDIAHLLGADLPPAWAGFLASQPGAESRARAAGASSLPPDTTPRPHPDAAPHSAPDVAPSPGAGSQPADRLPVAGTFLRDAPPRRPAGETQAAAAPQHLPRAYESATPLTVHCAGLVLLHPYLSRLFAALELQDADQRLSDLPRAAALLHWLATGRDAVYEFELGAIKVLLGLDPDTPLPVAAGLLNDADRAEAQALLEAAVSHWRALKSTSVEGLRISFLQRPGLLSATDQGWLLRLEPESFDLLLSSLPWGIGIIKLPWMPRPLYTEWPTP